MRAYIMSRQRISDSNRSQSLFLVLFTVLRISIYLNKKKTWIWYSTKINTIINKYFIFNKKKAPIYKWGGPYFYYVWQSSRHSVMNMLYGILKQTRQQKKKEENDQPHTNINHDLNKMQLPKNNTNTQKLWVKTTKILSKPKKKKSAELMRVSFYNRWECRLLSRSSKWLCMRNGKINIIVVWLDAKVECFFFVDQKILFLKRVLLYFKNFK